MSDTLITVIVDNKAQEGLTAEHGLSLWIEQNGHRLFFDTGQGVALPANARKLGVDIAKAEAVILSHGHYDHTGGVAAVLKDNPAVKVYCHPAAVQPRYSLRQGLPRPIHMPHVTTASLGAVAHHRIHWVTDVTALTESVSLTGSIPRYTDYEDAGGPFFLDSEGSRPDPIEDDIALWISTQGGLVVCVGCAHAGIINTLTHISRTSDNATIRAVIGGFHLADASDKRIAETAAALKIFEPDLVVPCHCSGDKAVHALREVLGERVQPGYAGMTLRLP